jgi:hypothetical protein
LDMFNQAILEKKGVSSVQSQLWPLDTIKICMK